MSQHRFVLKIEDGYTSWSLICPDDGSCGLRSGEYLSDALARRQGTGHEQVIPATDLRTWIEANGWARDLLKDPWRNGYNCALTDLSTWLDEQEKGTP